MKHLSAKAGDVGLILGQEDSLEEKMTTHTSILAWEAHGQRRGHKESAATEHTHCGLLHSVVTLDTPAKSYNYGEMLSSVHSAIEAKEHSLFFLV